MFLSNGIRLQHVLSLCTTGCWGHMGPSLPSDCPTTWGSIYQTYVRAVGSVLRLKEGRKEENRRLRIGRKVEHG